MQKHDLYGRYDVYVSVFDHACLPHHVGAADFQNEAISWYYYVVSFKYCAALLKKPDLNLIIVSNYKPIEKLRFMFKLLENVFFFFLQLTEIYLDAYSLLEVFSHWSGLHSREL